jgi:steroid 5-alpha reductase family enzyme
MGSSVLILAVYFCVWALVHSLLASLPVKDGVRRALGSGVERWYRLAYVVLATVTASPMLWMVARLPDRTLYVAPSPWRWLMVAVVQAGPAYFLGLSQWLARRRAQAGVLQVRGFYCWVRHPLYLFSIILLWLTPTMTANLCTLYALMTLYFYVGSFHEENRLLVEFGVVYRDYQHLVPRLIPWPGRCYVPPWSPEVD